MVERLLITCLLVGLSAAANAALIDRGNGLIYDNVLNVTWLQDANAGAGSLFDDGLSSTDGKMTWASALAWAADLEFGGFSDWRLPSMDVNGDHMPTGTFDNGIVNCEIASELDCRDNELGYMFYHNLMGSRGVPLSGDQAPFTNIQPTHWSSTAYAPNPIAAWDFSFFGGGQGLGTPDNLVGLGAWAVRSGDVAVIPLPGAVWLLGSGVLGLAGLLRGVRRR